MLKAKPLLVVSAAKFECQKTLAEILNQNVEFEYLELGIGPLNASFTIGANQSLFKDREILFLGSAGIYQEKPIEHPYLVQPRFVCFLPIADRFNLSESVEGVFPPIKFSGKENAMWLTQEDLKDIQPHDFLCSSTISLNSNIDKNIIPKECDLSVPLAENLELYSLAPILDQIKSIVCLIGITNNISETGRNQWKQNFKKVDDLTARFVQSALS